MKFTPLAPIAALIISTSCSQSEFAEPSHEPGRSRAKSRDTASPDYDDQLARRWSDWIEARAPSAHRGESIVDWGGQVFHCVEYEWQPAFRQWEMARTREAAKIVQERANTGGSITEHEVDVMLERAYPLATRPPHEPLPLPELPADADGSLDEFGDLELARCGDGLVPIQEVTVDDIAAAGSLEEFLDPPEPQAAPGSRLYDVIRHTSGDHIGTEAVVNMWNPFVHASGEFSLVQTWVSRGVRTGDPATDTEQRIEVGWQKWWGNQYPQLFVYTKKSLSKKCYEPSCGVMVMLPGTYSPGLNWILASQLNGSQFTTTIRVHKDSGGAWWVKVNNSYVGLYPSGTFNAAGLRDYASRIEWGLEVVDATPTNGVTTMTDQGSGKFASEGYGRALFLRDLKRLPRNSSTWTTYNVSSSISFDAGCNSVDVAPTGYPNYVFMGGPNNPTPSCP